MAACLLCAPAVFPWYLLWLLPFLTSSSTLLISLWTVSIVPTYVMWHMRALGSSVGGAPRLGYVGGIRVRRYRCRNYWCAADSALARARVLNPVAASSPGYEPKYC